MAMAPGYAVQEIEPGQCLQLRRDVLWPQLELAQCRLQGDEQARHFGICVEGVVVSCLSLFEMSDGIYQLRKFATHAGFRNQGLGSALLAHAIVHVQAAGGRGMVLNARLSALPFYRRHGFVRHGRAWRKSGVDFVEMRLQAW